MAKDCHVPNCPTCAALFVEAVAIELGVEPPPDTKAFLERWRGVHGQLRITK